MTILRTWLGAQYGSNGAGWRDLLANLQATRRVINEKGALMSPFEQSVFQEELQHTIDTSGPAIRAGILAEHKAARAAYQTAQKAYSTAADKEASRWIPEKLMSATQYVQNQLAAITPKTNLVGDPFNPERAALKDRLIAIYNDNMRSSDIYMKRATAEVYRSLDQDKFPATQSLIEQARSAWDEVRTIPENNEAAIAMQVAKDKLGLKQDELAEVATALGDHPNYIMGAATDLERALKTVRMDKAGNVTVLADDDPIVTGITYSEGAPK